MTTSKKKVSFTGYSDDVVKLSMIISGLLLNTFKTREALPLMKTFNSYIGRKQQTTAQYRNPGKKENIVMLYGVQNNFIS